MGLREVLDALLVPSVHSELALKETEKALINHGGSLGSLRSLKQTDSLGKLVACANENLIIEGRNQCALEEVDYFLDFTSLETNYDIFRDFFNQAELAGLELLAGDKRFLRDFGCEHINKELFNQYIKCWLDAMNSEQISFRKQNKGRFAANTFIRESMENGD